MFKEKIYEIPIDGCSANITLPFTKKNDNFLLIDCDTICPEGYSMLSQNSNLDIRPVVTQENSVTTVSCEAVTCSNNPNNKESKL